MPKKLLVSNKSTTIGVVVLSLDENGKGQHQVVFGCANDEERQAIADELEELANEFKVRKYS